MDDFDKGQVPLLDDNEKVDFFFCSL